MPTRAPAWAPPLLALQLLTRLPVPFVARLQADAVRDGMTRTVAWLPLAGTLIGVATACVYAAALHLWPPAIAAGVALAVEALVTGALHEDAVADFCDAFGGAATGDEARRIMRDSRIGSYGALGLILLVGLRWTATAALPPPLATPAIVAAATIGRALPAGLLALVPPIDAAGSAAGLGTPSARVTALALLLALPGTLPLFLASPAAAIAAVVAVAALLGCLARLVGRRLGGSTGDCLGTAIYIGQLAVLLAALGT